MRLEQFRTTILISLGLQMGCTTAGVLSNDDTDTDDSVDTGAVVKTCDDVPKATPANTAEVEQGGQWLVCGDATGEDGGCRSLEELNAFSFINAALGPPADEGICSWDPMKVCGPEESIKDQCCYVLDVALICEGRPLRVDGEHAFASVEPGDAWIEHLTLDLSTLSEHQRQFIGALWAESAQAEHASIAAFAGFVSELLTLGAPASMIAAAQQAMGDEIHHAKACFSLMSAFLGTAYGPGTYPQATLGGPFSMEAMLRNLVLDGCLNETIAAAVAAAESSMAVDETVQEVLAKIATDERRHATLAWKTLHWVLQRHPEWSEKVRVWFDEGIAAHWAQEYASHPWTHPWGRLSGEAKGQVVRAALIEVVGPCGVQVLDATKANAGSSTIPA